MEMQPAGGGSAFMASAISPEPCPRTAPSFLGHRGLRAAVLPGLALRRYLSSDDHVHLDAARQFGRSGGRPFGSCAGTRPAWSKAMIRCIAPVFSIPSAPHLGNFSPLLLPCAAVTCHCPWSVANDGPVATTCFGCFRPAVHRPGDVLHPCGTCFRHRPSACLGGLLVYARRSHASTTPMAIWN